MDSTLNQLQEIVREVFENDDITLEREITAADVDEWDSFNHVRLMIAIEDHYGISFPTGEVADLRDVGEMVDIIDKYSKG